MTCGLEQGKPDWKAYILDELDASARGQAEAHASSCAACQDEVASLRITLDAMSTLREEEMPRRIAFVSDKVFEPKWWQAFLRPSFAAGAVIAAAILVHAFVRPVAPASQNVAQVGSAQVDALKIDTAAIEAKVSAEVAKRVEAQLNAALNTAVTKAVADARKSDEEHTAQMLAASERRYGQSAELMTRQVSQMYALNSGLGVR